MLKKVGIAAATVLLGWAVLLLTTTDRSTATPKPGELEGLPAPELFDFGGSSSTKGSIVSQALDAARTDERFLFLYFHKESDSSKLLPVLHEAKSRIGDRAYFAVANVLDAAESMHLANYRIRGTPLLLVIAPNGAVSAGFGEGATPEDLEGALVSESIAKLTLAIQDRSVVFLVVGNPERIYFEQAVATADSSVALLEGIGRRIVLDPYDEDTRRILKNSRVEIDPDLTELLVISPSGGIAARFPGNATQRDLLDSFQRILAQNKGCGARTLTGGSPCEPGRGVSGGRGCGASESSLP